MNPTLQMKPGLLILALLFFFALTIAGCRAIWRLRIKRERSPYKKSWLHTARYPVTTPPFGSRKRRGFFKKYGLDVQSSLD